MSVICNERHVIGKMSRSRLKISNRIFELQSNNTFATTWSEIYKDNRKSDTNNMHVRQSTGKTFRHFDMRLFQAKDYMIKT